MLAVRVMPCLLLQDGRLVKTIRFKNPLYVGDPINAIKIYNDKEVDELIVLDIAACAEGRGPDFKIIEFIAAECFMPMTYGGGIRSIEDIRMLFSIGVEKVAINTLAVEDSGFIRRAAGSFGSQSIVVSLDARRNLWGRYELFIRGARKATGLDPVSFAAKCEQEGAGELLLNSVDNDGTMQGYDINLIRQVSFRVSIPVIACGGASGIEDFGEAVKKGGASAVAAGSFFVYHGRNHAVLINFPTRQELEKVLA